MSIAEITTEIETEDNLEEAVQLIIPPHNSLFRCIVQLDRILGDGDTRGTIVRIARCFDRNTLITLMLRTQNISNLVTNLASIRNVTKVVEVTPVTFAVSSLPNSIRLLRDSGIKPSKTLHLVLEDDLSP